MNPLVRQERADLNAEQVPDYYLVEAQHMVFGFLDAIEKSFAHIQRHHGTGSLRYAHAQGIPELRFWVCQWFPQMEFYVERDDHIALIRVLHDSRDTSANFQDLTD